jgi:hypothetical protein
MAKPKRKNPPQDPYQKIVERLRTDFDCTEEQAHLLTQVLHGYLPTPDAEYVQRIEHGEVKLPDLPSITLDTEDEAQTIRLTNHPLILMLFYLREKYGEKFGFLYWSALTDIDDPQRYYRELAYFKKHTRPV